MTQARLEQIQKILQKGVRFEIWAFCETRHYIASFVLDKAGYTYPWREYSDGSGGGGAATNLVDSSKQILKLIRDNHDVSIQNIWMYVEKLAPEKARKEIIEIAWPESSRLAELYAPEMTLFCGDPEEMAKINKEYEIVVSNSKREREKIYRGLKTSIQLYRNSRKENGEWDQDNDLD